MADFFWIGSGKGNGTVVHVRKVIKRVIRHHNSQREIQYLPPGRNSKFDLGTCTRPIEGEGTSGDGAFAVTLDKGIILAIVDVTGHGSAAHELALKIANVIQTYANEDLIYLLNKIHESLFGTLGAAIGLIYVNTDRHNFSYVGIGNTSASRCVGNPWRGVSDGMSFFAKSYVLSNLTPNPKSYDALKKTLLTKNEHQLFIELQQKTSDLELQKSAILKQQKSLQDVLDNSPICMGFSIGGIYRYLNKLLTDEFGGRTT